MDKRLRQRILAHLESQHGSREAGNIMRLLADHLAQLPGGSQEFLLKAAEQLEQGLPVQYVTGTAWFYGRPFIVTRDVLIPRPETEEIVHWILSDIRQAAVAPLRGIDIGTGSGCIALTLKLEHPGLMMEAVDVSPGAIDVAQRNADHLEASIELRTRDFLSTGFSLNGRYDVIVSNP
ncbi:MAG: HemK/PrmC family methyltransferase, partial [Saprospiraceae bacterium]|nr:HemK/PrmC family methyltransferase [Saprospiraceae bacterium]